jgi:hypothetical protein
MPRRRVTWLELVDNTSIYRCLSHVFVMVQTGAKLMVAVVHPPQVVDNADKDFVSPESKTAVEPTWVV